MRIKTKIFEPIRNDLIAFDKLFIDNSPMLALTIFGKLAVIA